MFKELGLRCVALHSCMPQAERLGSLAKFKSGIINILVSTDVGSRLGFVFRFHFHFFVFVFVCVFAH